MKSNETLITAEGLEDLKKELDELKLVKRKEISEKIKTALAFGDISENSEYEDAKNEQAFIEGRILEMEKMLRNAKIIDEGEVGGDTVTLGSTVVLNDIEYGDEETYTIVGSAEADPKQSRISNVSPVGEAILGKKVGSIVEVNVPAGILKYKIVGIKGN